MDDPAALVTAWTRALNDDDPAAVATCFGADATCTDLGTGQTAKGRDEVFESAAGFLGMFSDLRIEKTNVLVAGSRFADEWVMTGLHTGDVPGLPATGRSFQVEGACVGEVRDGAIARATVYWNMAEFLVQVGVLPPTGG